MGAVGGFDAGDRCDFTITLVFSVRRSFRWRNGGITDKFSPAVLAHLFRPAIVNKSSTEHHSASGLFP